MSAKTTDLELYRRRDLEKIRRDLFAREGKDALNRIFESPNPAEFVMALPNQDFYWLIKRIGVEDCQPILSLAGTDQWQYLMDLEVWERDRLDLTKTGQWLEQLMEADPDRLAQWLLEKGKELTYQYLSRNIEVAEYSDDTAALISEDAFSLDGLFYIHVIDPNQRIRLEKLLRVMADEDYETYRGILQELIVLIPAEMDEDAYRIRNVRLAEQGFLPFEEAVGIYSSLDPKLLNTDQPQIKPGILDQAKPEAVVPLTPMFHVGAEYRAVRLMTSLDDLETMDRVYLEFAALSNQLLCADVAPPNEPERITASCRKAASYISLALEKICGTDDESAARLLTQNKLDALFRVGYGLVMKIKWETERWLKSSWFHRHELTTGFWGDEWGNQLEGLLSARPRYFAGAEEENPFRDFQHVTDLAEIMKVLLRLMVLDSLLDTLNQKKPVEPQALSASGLTFRQLIFTFWGRGVLGLEPGFSAFDLEQARQFLQKIRETKDQPTHVKDVWRERFLQDFQSLVRIQDTSAQAVLRESLTGLWVDFQEENERISMQDIDPRYSGFVWVE